MLEVFPIKSLSAAQLSFHCDIGLSLQIFACDSLKTAS